MYVGVNQVTELAIHHFDNSTCSITPLYLTELISNLFPSTKTRCVPVPYQAELISNSSSRQVNFVNISVLLSGINFQLIILETRLDVFYSPTKLN